MNTIHYFAGLEPGDTFTIVRKGTRFRLRADGKAEAIDPPRAEFLPDMRVYDVITIAEQTLPLPGRQLEAPETAHTLKAANLALEACRRLRDACRVAAEVGDTVDPSAVDVVWQWASAALRANKESDSLVRGIPRKR